MAAIGRRALLAVVAAAGLKGADDPENALRAINRLTTALSDSDAQGAIEAFDSSCPDYEKLSQYFVALTNSFAITNEADLTDQRDAGSEVILQFDWTLTLRSLASDRTIRREQQVTAKIARKNWKIASFSPAALFNPA